MASELPAKVTGPWRLEDLRSGRLGSPKNGLKVFSVFACGGGSTMGYKLAGFDVVGCCEIDPEMMGLYRRNHNPRVAYQMPIQEMKNLAELPAELYQLDILDGSPPCSSFSMAGSREDAWGEEKMFREGQAKQVLDDLFFHFIDLGKRLQPKVIVAENVKGLILGKARGYVKEIFRAFREAGYECQLFLLNSSRMGVPQRRERTFFLARRIDLGLPPIKLSFDEPEIPVRDALVGCSSLGRSLPKSLREDWDRLASGRQKRYSSTSLLNPSEPASTLTSKVTSSEGSVMHWAEPRKLSGSEAVRIQTFPEDFDFSDIDPGYVLGMSVPPLMMQRVALSVARQWLSGDSDSGPLPGPG